MRLLPFWRHLRNGAAAGVGVGAGVTIWRVAREGSPGWTAVGFAASALVLGALLSLYFVHWVPKHVRKAEPMPADAAVVDRGTLKWWGLLAGVGYGLGGIGAAGDDSAIVSGVMTGAVAGGLVAMIVAVARLSGWQAESGQELLQWRRGGLRNPHHYLRPTERSGSRRFARERLPTARSSSSGH